MKAEQRRALAVRAAVVEFGHGGFEATSTASIARRSGVSQPYLFRLFPSKKALFAAAADWCMAQLTALLTAAAAGNSGEEAMRAMASAYAGGADARHDFHRFQLAIYAAAADPELRGVARRNFQALWSAVADAADADEAAVRAFFAEAALTMITSALEGPATSAAPEPTGPDPVGPAATVNGRPRQRAEVLATAQRLAAQPGLTDRLSVPCGQRAWVSLDAGEDAEAWLIGWPPGTGTPWHDHGGAEGAMAVVAGELTEHAVEAPAGYGYGSGLRLPGGTGHIRVLSAGRARAFSGRHIHMVANQGRETAFSVHVYAPGLPAMREYLQIDGALVVSGLSTRADW